MEMSKVIETLRCAETNCDNAKRVPPMIDIVKAQIQDAIRALDDEIFAVGPLDEIKAKISSGVRSENFGIFQDEGYKGLYGGIGVRDIKAKKGIGKNEELLDCIGRAELAANEFRITQTEEKLRIEQIRGEQQAINTHRDVGRKVRQAIKNIGATMPENLPAEPSIKRLAAAEAKAERKRLKPENKGC
jgi:hypothetical protein